MALRELRTNDTRIHVILKVARTISFNCCTCMFQQYCTRVNKGLERHNPVPRKHGRKRSTSPIH